MEFLTDLAVRCCKAAGKKWLHHVGASPEYDADDLANDFFIVVKENWGRFDPSRKIHPSTWIYRLCWNKVRDKSRRLGARVKRETRYVEMKPGVTLAEEPESLEEWTIEAYRAAKATIERYGVKPWPGKTSHNRPTIAQVIALHALRVKLNQTVRGMETVLVLHPELLRAVEITSIPSFMFFSRAASRVTSIGFRENFFAGRGKRRVA